jgi:hypothetical protein
MNRWTMGKAEIENCWPSGSCNKSPVPRPTASTSSGAQPAPLLTASDIVDDDPDNGYILAYDAARYAGTALLAQQGLRPTTSGGHYAVELAPVPIRKRVSSIRRDAPPPQRTQYPSGPVEPPLEQRHAR